MRRVALIRIIKFDAKTVMIKEKGSFNLYAARNKLIPKNKKKQATKTNRHCRIHHNKYDIMLKKIEERQNCKIESWDLDSQRRSSWEKLLFC